MCRAGSRRFRSTNIRSDAVKSYELFKIAPRWLHYCEKMRLNPQLYWKMIGPDGRPGGADHDIITGDAYVGHGTAPWISEMYGYVFAASEAGLKHILTDGVVVYPDDIGAGRSEEDDMAAAIALSLAEQESRPKKAARVPRELANLQEEHFDEEVAFDDSKREEVSDSQLDRHTGAFLSGPDRPRDPHGFAG